MIKNFNSTVLNSNAIDIKINKIIIPRKWCNKVGTKKGGKENKPNSQNANHTQSGGSTRKGFK